MKNSLVGVILFSLFFSPFSALPQENEGLRPVDEDYIGLSLCIHMASTYYHEEEGLSPVKAVGRGSTKCRDEENKYISSFLSEPNIISAKRINSISDEDAAQTIKDTNVFEMKINVLRDIENGADR